ncbi:hypothetical protein B4V02_03235 [Paenibacillus kribbensis]|uniref:Uncharacterized protein n=1 Tax=Paenibacillus kribbensis TaxID=172713 RepID=A0A222WHD3_9BACL|nr:TnsD family Tn7-like transposition protein [Paenibacillus kribbensis]ASR45780.1 hypothetical protein B4V02_03235 [Paenibacillus kribbensis]
MKSIAFFPTPFPGEDFRSVLYRYHILSLNPEISSSNKELFGSGSNFTTFPRALGKLLEKLPTSVLTVNQIIENHTLIPVLFPFLSKSKKEYILNDVKRGEELKDSFVGKLVGNKNGKLVSPHIKYCPYCIKEDMSKYGWSFIHREHQFAFIHNCHVHSIALLTHCNECGLEFMYSPVNGTCKNGHEILISSTKDINNDFERNLYNDLEYLFLNFASIDLSLIKIRFIEYLNANGYLDSNGQVRRLSLIKDFLNYYSPSVFETFGLNKKHMLQRYAVESVLYNENLVVNLPFNLLLIRYLAGSIKIFIQDQLPYTCDIPFPIGPWRCENKFCPKYQQFTIKKRTCEEMPSKRIIGKFSCEFCEGEYKMEWKEIKKPKYKMITFPEKKVELVCALLENGQVPAEIAEKLYCSEYLVKEIMKNKYRTNPRIISSTYFQEVASTIENEMENSKRNLYRKKILEIIKDNPELGRYQLSLKCKSEYHWLKRNDRSWLEGHVQPSRSFNRFDWSVVDEALAIRIREVGKLLLKSNPNMRIGSYTIINAMEKIERGRLKSYIQHLPKSKVALEECAETKEDYQIRHLPALVWQLRHHYNYKSITIEVIMAYRRSYRGISDEMKEILSEKLKSL